MLRNAVRGEHGRPSRFSKGGPLCGVRRRDGRARTVGGLAAPHFHPSSQDLLNDAGRPALTVPPCPWLGSGKPALDRYPEICSASAHCSRSKGRVMIERSRAGPISQISGEARDVVARRSGKVEVRFVCRRGGPRRVTGSGLLCICPLRRAPLGSLSPPALPLGAAPCTYARVARRTPGCRRD
jgi:hypothetical protein